MNCKNAVAVLSSALLFCSCMTIKQPAEVYKPLDYTESDVAEAEKKKILQMQEKEPVEALWRSVLLGDSATKEQCSQSVKKMYDAALEKKDYYASLTYYRSLKAVGCTDAELSYMTDAKLSALYRESVPGLTPDSEKLPETIADCINATVTIWVDRGIKIENGAGYADRIIGSGFFIDRRGYIVTNHHVISDLVDPKYEGYSRLFVKLARDTETRIPAKVVGYDSVLDLALLKVEVDAPFVLALGSSADLSIGDKVSAIGTPLGLDGTLTQGIVSAVNRKLFTTGSVLQIDAAVNSGNSGGPCIDSQMRVQAIVFAGMLQYQGLNFAIPVEYLRQDLPMLYHGGKREHPWLGAFGHTKKSADGRENTGLEVQYVMPGGSASRASLPEHSLVISVDNQPVDSLEAMQDILRNYIPGTIVRCVYFPDPENSDETKECLVYLESRPKNPGFEMYSSDLLNGSFVPIYGMRLENISTVSRRKYMVTEIIKGGVADESGFSVNDPVTVSSVKFNDDNSIIYAELYTRRSKKGYLDVSLGLAAQLDSPYYF